MALPSFLAAFLAGLFLAPYVTFSNLSLMFLAASLLLAVAAFLPRRWRTLSAFPGLALFAVVLVQQAQALPQGPDALQRFAGPEKLSVTGEVQALGRSSSGNRYYDLRVEKLIKRGIEVRAEGALRLYLKDNDAPFVVGDRLCFLARLRTPRLFSTPGEYDAVRELARRGIHTLTFVEHTGDIVRLAARRNATLAERWRKITAGLIQSALSHRPDLAGLVRALAQGERFDMVPEQRTLLAASGLSHLFAISGLHFGLVAAALYACGAWLWRRSLTLLEFLPARRVLPLLLVPPLYAYLCFSGEAVSSWRSFLVLTFAAVVMVSLRRVDPLRILFAVALVMLLFDPLLVYSAAFQLSFAATLAILLVVGRCQPAWGTLPAWQRYPLAVVVTTLTASLATLPLVGLHFHQVPVAGVFANLLAVPLVSFLALPLALLGVLTGPWMPSVAGPCFWLCGQLLSWLVDGAAWLLEVPGMAAISWFPPPATWLAVSLLVGMLLLLVAGRKHLAIAAFLAMPCVLIPWQSSPALAVTALSVGQGEALLLSYDGNRHVLIDAGGFAESSFDVGERLVVPALARMGVTHLDAVVLTHAHPDHMLGLSAVLKYLPCDALWTAVDREALPLPVQLEVSSGRIEVYRPRQGWQQISLDGETLQLYVPDAGGSGNDASLVVYVQQGGEGVLLTGDLESEGTRRLLASPPPGPVSLLKLPHHGSRHSEQLALLEGFSPALALVSSGHDNPYRLPHSDTVALYAQREVPLWRTDLHGTLRFTSSGDAWSVTRWKEGAFVDISAGGLLSF